MVAGPQEPTRAPAVSVVVGTCDRSRSLAATVRSVLASADVELDLVVVDQSTGDETCEALAPLRSDPRLRYVRSHTQGVSRARNIGLRLARHPLVLLTDDDVIVDPSWASRFAIELQDLDRVAVAFCRVEPAPHDRDRGFVPDHRIDESRIVKSLLSKSRARGIGAGMAVRRDAVLEFGGFDELLGPGAPMRSGEDRDLAARALSLGWWVYQTPRPVVEHAGFRTWEQGRRLTRRDWYGIGAAYAKQVKVGDLKILPVLAHEVAYFGVIRPIARTAAGHRHVGLRRLGYFLAGFVRGLRTPIDRSTMLYRPRTPS